MYISGFIADILVCQRVNRWLHLNVCIRSATQFFFSPPDFEEISAEQMFCSDDVRTPFESAPDDADFDALRQVLISDSTCEIVDIPEKPCQVKFTWRYASNRIAQKNPVKDELFTEQYNYSFK